MPHGEVGGQAPVATASAEKEVWPSDWRGQSMDGNGSCGGMREVGGDRWGDEDRAEGEVGMESRPRNEFEGAIE